MAKDAKQELADARKALGKIKVTDESSPGYKAANDRVVKAERALPWRKR